MTITYTAQVATCRHLGCFWKLLFRWKGSIYKLLWLNMLLYIILFMSIKFAFCYLMNDQLQKTMLTISYYCHAYEQTIPLSFLLGFYVAIVITRWWEQYMSIPWPDGLAVLVSVFLTGQDVRGRVMRRTIMRYANLCLVMTFTMISPFVKRRFPNYQSYVDAGLLLPSEHQRMKELEKRTTHPKHWLPLVWAIAIVARARREGKIADDVSKETIITEINTFRGTCGSLLNYDWISIPLVYPQVVSWAVYTYFATTIISYQFPVNQNFVENDIVMILPIFPMLQFFFYMGWLLVAETLANPFGEDDDDFDIGWLIDRNIQVSYCIADEMHNTHPELLKDQYWDDVLPPDLPWTPHTDMDEPSEMYDDQKDPDPKSEENSEKNKEGWHPESEVPVNFAKADFISRSLDFGSERVIRVYLPPSMSRITFGSRTINRSVLSKGSRPSGDSKLDHFQLKDVVHETRASEARTRLLQNTQKRRKVEEKPRFAARFSDDSEARIEDDNDDQEISENDLKYESNIINNENLIYNQAHDPNHDLINPSSRNILHIDNTDDGNDNSFSTASSFGLRLLLSENVIQKMNEIAHSSKDDAGTPFDNDNIIVQESSKISKGETFIHKFKSRSSHKSILKNQEELQTCTDEITSQEEKSVLRTISLPVTFAKEFISDIEGIVNEYSLQESDSELDQGKSIELIQVYNQQFRQDTSDEISSSHTVFSTDLPGNSKYRFDTESLCLSSTSDSQLISDGLFDHILNLEMSKPQQQNKMTKEFQSLDNQSMNQILKENDETIKKLSTSKERKSDMNIDIQESVHPTDPIHPISEMGFQRLLSDNLSRQDHIDFRPRIDEFNTRETMERSFPESGFATLKCEEDSCVYEVVDEVTYNVDSEDNTIIFDEIVNEGVTVNEANIQHGTDQFKHITETPTLRENMGFKRDKAEELYHDDTSSPCICSNNEKGTSSSQLDSSLNTTAQASRNSIEDIEDFRNKVEQSLSFKYCSLSPSQPKISSVIQQSSPLPTVVELPEDADSCTDLP